MLTIHLQNLQFYAFHGVFEEEKKSGAAYEVNVSVSHPEKNIPVLHLNETIDYTSVYELVKKAMQQPRELLETVATSLAADIFTTFGQAEKISITIIKKHPPIIAFEGSVAVTYTAERNNRQTT